MATTKQSQKPEDKVLDVLLKGIVSEEASKSNLTETELYTLVYENLKVTKSAQLKWIRSEGFKVSQNRCYNAYIAIEKATKTNTSEESKEA